MSKKFILSGCLLFFFTIARTQSYFYSIVDDTTDTNDAMHLESVVSTNDGGVLICGYTLFSGIIISLDSTGTVKWAKRYDANVSVEFHTIYSHDSSFYIGGNTEEQFSKALLLNIDKQGNILDTKVIDAVDKYLSVNEIIPYNNQLLLNCVGDGIFILKMDSAGNFSVLNSTNITSSNDYTRGIYHLMADGNDVYLLGTRITYPSPLQGQGLLGKLTSNGEIAWCEQLKTQGEAYTSIISGLVNTNHTITLHLISGPLGLFSGKLTFAHLDSVGVEISTLGYQGDPSTQLLAGDVYLKNDSSFVAALYLGAGDSSMLVANYDKNYQTLWSYRYPKWSHPTSVAAMKDNSIITVGNMDEGTANSFILKLPPDGIGCKQSPLVLDDNSKDILTDEFHLFEPSDTTIVVSTMSFTVSSPLTITDSCSFFNGIADNYLSGDVSIYPNPFSDEFLISLASNTEALMSIYDIQGKMIYSTIIHSRFEGGNELQPGIYFVQLAMPNSAIITKKLVKLKQ